MKTLLVFTSFFQQIHQTISQLMKLFNTALFLSLFLVLSCSKPETDLSNISSSYFLGKWEIKQSPEFSTQPSPLFITFENNGKAISTPLPHMANTWYYNPETKTLSLGSNQQEYSIEPSHPAEFRAVVKLSGNTLIFQKQ